MEVATAALGLNVFRGVAAVKPYHMDYSKYAQGHGSQGRTDTGTEGKMWGIGLPASLSSRGRHALRGHGGHFMRAFAALGAPL